MKRGGAGSIGCNALQLRRKEEKESSNTAKSSVLIVIVYHLKS